MSSLITLFLAIIAVLGPLNTGYTASAQSLDINKILELVQNQRVNSGANKQSRLRLPQDSSETSSDTDSDSDDETESDESDDSDSNRYGRTNNDKLLDLINTLVKERKYKARDNEYAPYNNEKPQYRQNNYVNRNENRDNAQDYANTRTQNILEKLFGSNLNVEERKIKLTGANDRKRVNPSRLLPNRADDDYNREDNLNSLDGYSKVYIVLNPNAARQSRNKNALNDLISKVLSLSGSASKRDRSVNNKPRRLKGLVVNDQVIRRSRQSREIYAPRDDSNGDDYKPKKSRGNPAGGHTAIPYVRNRGDIYERN